MEMMALKWTDGWDGWTCFTAHEELIWYTFWEDGDSHFIFRRANNRD